MKLTKYCVLSGLLLSTTTVLAEQTVLLKVQGIKEKALWGNVRIYLSQLNNNEADGSERYQYLVQETIDKGLRSMGYYHSSYRFSIEPRKRPQKDLLKLQVGLQSPVKINETEISIIGEARQDPDVIRLVNTVPAKGTILNHETYEDFKSSLQRLAQTKGYLDGQWLQHRLEVFPTKYIADWRLAYDSGVRYHYGTITFHNSQIREDYLRNMLRIKTGDPYLTYDLSRLNSDFSSSNWFTSVLTEPEVVPEKKAVNLNVLLLPRKKNSVEIGLGFATDVGARFQLGWKKPWLNDRGHSIESNLYISKPEQRFEFGYKMPLKKNPLKYYYELSGSMEREQVNDTKSTAATLGFQRFWNHETGWRFSLGVKARYDAFQQGNEPRYKTLLVYPTASMNRLRSDGKRFPVWGDSQNITVNWGNSAWGSDVNFYSIKASSAWVRTYFTNHRIYTRVEGGYIKANKFERIPPALRYFAGGDKSVRGYGYKKISPEDSHGKLVGGSHLATATVEYQYQVYPNWWGATFYDTGLASDRFKKSDLYHGAGIGVRWASPIGPIKLDIAKPLKTNDRHKGIQVYLGLGSEL